MSIREGERGHAARRQSFAPPTLWSFPGNISTVTLELMVAIAVNVLFGIGVAALWCRYSRVEGASVPKRRAGQTREVLEIDPANVPPFQATWRNIQ